MRLATLDDITALSALFDEYRVFYKKDSDVNGAKIFLADRLKNNESVIYVAEYDEILVGFVQLYPIFSSTRMKRLWLLNDLYVNTICRNKGIGAMLLDASKAYCKSSNACGLILETAKSNAANQLYINNGWELDNEHNYYSFDI